MCKALEDEQYILEENMNPKIGIQRSKIWLMREKQKIYEIVITEEQHRNHESLEPNLNKKNPNKW